jgi:hypothetical protein
MAHFLVTDENPKGYKLEDVLTRSLKTTDDKRPEAQFMMTNTMRVLALVT